MRLKAVGLSFAAWFFLWGAAVCFAQSAGGVAGISGEVKDPSGSTVPNAKVVISSVSRGELRTLTTNGSGIFTAPALIPGAGYKVAVTAAGFAPYEANNIELQVGQNLNLNISLTVGQTSTSVDVNAAAQLLDDTKTDVSQVVSTREIMNLPINGRRVDSFVLNTAGVTNDATFGLLTFRGVAGNNSFLLDGNDNTEQFYDENAGRTRIASQISADAVQEFQVVSANVSAEYGRAMGGVVNTVTKSGGNAVHGSAFYFLRSTGFDAHDPYASFNPTEHRIQTGGTVGGAIIKDKLFYFLSADITRRNFPFVDSQVKVGFLDPVNQVWLGCAAPATPAQCSAINGLLPRFYGQLPRTASNDLYFGRISTTTPTATLSARASITCAGNRPTASRPAFLPPPARASRATATTASLYAMGRRPGPPCSATTWSIPFATDWIPTARRTVSIRRNWAVASATWMCRWPASSLDLRRTFRASSPWKSATNSPTT